MVVSTGLAWKVLKVVQPSHVPFRADRLLFVMIVFCTGAQLTNAIEIKSKLMPNKLIIFFIVSIYPDFFHVRS